MLKCVRFTHMKYIDVKHTKSHINDIADLSNFNGHIILHFFNTRCLTIAWQKYFWYGKELP